MTPSETTFSPPRKDSALEIREAEQAVLGACLSAATVLDELSLDLRLRPEHFGYESHALVYRSMLELRDADKGIDELTLSALEVKIDRGLLAQCRQAAIVTANFRQYAAIVIEAADWRRVNKAALMLAHSAESRDVAKREQAEALLSAPSTELAQRRRTPEQLRDAYWSFLEGGAEQFSWPFGRLNELTHGGMRRKQTTLIAAWTSHGKSMFLDQCLALSAARGLRAHLFINEMSDIDRVGRLIAAATGIGVGKQLTGKLSVDEHRAVLEALGKLPFGITDIDGLSADEIAREIKRSQLDVAGVDILHRIPHEDEKDMRHISNVISGASRGNPGCHVLATVHLNERRSDKARLPRPQLGDIRQSGMLKNDADNVLFLHREQGETGNLKPETSIYFRKVRSGATGGLSAIFNGDRMRFELPPKAGDEQPEAVLATRSLVAALAQASLREGQE